MSSEEEVFLEQTGISDSDGETEPMLSDEEVLPEDETDAQDHLPAYCACGCEVTQRIRSGGQDISQLIDYLVEDFWFDEIDGSITFFPVPTSVVRLVHPQPGVGVSEETYQLDASRYLRDAYYNPATGQRTNCDQAYSGTPCAGYFLTPTAAPIWFDPYDARLTADARAAIQAHARRHIFDLELVLTSEIRTALVCSAVVVPAT